MQQTVPSIFSDLAADSYVVPASAYNGASGEPQPEAALTSADNPSSSKESKTSILGTATHHSIPTLLFGSEHVTPSLSSTPAGSCFSATEGTDLNVSSGSDYPSAGGREVNETIACPDNNLWEDFIHLSLPGSSMAHRPGKRTSRQRKESDKQQRNVLRDGFAELKSALPNPRQPASRAAVLSGAVAHIRQFETSQESLQTRLDRAETELTRLRAANEQLTTMVVVALAKAQGVSSSV